MILEGKANYIFCPNLPSTYDLRNSSSTNRADSAREQSVISLDYAKGILRGLTFEERKEIREFLDLILDTGEK
ncbi:MAG: hypothetical protein M3367_03095 [Acidobacteriota bacterium]|nr:hypothetical protein [Acidobacteriota bacterium]